VTTLPPQLREQLVDSLARLLIADLELDEARCAAEGARDREDEGAA
jgi:hypothetical protein